MYFELKNIKKYDILFISIYSHKMLFYFLFRLRALHMQGFQRPISDGGGDSLPLFRWDSSQMGETLRANREIFIKS